MLAAILFWIFGVIAVASAVAVFRTDSMARASYALAVSFVAVGAIVVQIRLDYIGVIMVLMMVMEMAVMAVFMVMFMGMNPALMPMDMTHDKRRSVVVSLVVFAALAAAALLIPWPARTGAAPADAVESLGSTIMSSKMLVMLTISPVLFATIVSALVLANPRSRYDRYGDGLDRRTPDDPQRGGVGR